jgi:hypothetical protein
VAAAGFMRAALSAPGAVLLKAGRVFAAPREPLIQPSEISSQDGILSTNLTAALGRVQLGESSFDGFLYNERYIPPLLRVRLGDTVQLCFATIFPTICVPPFKRASVWNFSAAAGPFFLIARRPFF